MSDYPQIRPEDRPRRGRRDPQLQQQLEQGIVPEEELPDVLPDAEQPLLNVGDEVEAKVTIAYQLDDPQQSRDASYFTYAVKTTVLPGEAEEDVHERVQLVVNNRVLNLIDDAEQKLAEREAARRAAPIVRQR